MSFIDLYKALVGIKLIESAWHSIFIFIWLYHRSMHLKQSSLTDVDNLLCKTVPNLKDTFWGSKLVDAFYNIFMMTIHLQKTLFFGIFTVIEWQMSQSFFFLIQYTALHVWNTLLRHHKKITLQKFSLACCRTY